MFGFEYVKFVMPFRTEWRCRLGSCAYVEFRVEVGGLGI